MRFFECIRLYADPRLSDRELSDQLNAFEAALFDRHPEALCLPEDAQNAIVLAAWANVNTRH